MFPRIGWPFFLFDLEPLCVAPLSPATVQSPESPQGAGVKWLAISPPAACKSALDSAETRVGGKIQNSNRT
jgi:hypothetical protein